MKEVRRVTLELKPILLLVPVLMMLVPGLASADPSPQSGTTVYMDPVTRDVIRLLSEGLTSELVSEWLEKTGKRPAYLRAEDLIALKQSGASEALVQELIYLADLDEQAPGPAPSPAEAAPAAEPPSGPVDVEFTLDYSPWGKGWHLFVYVNGEFLIWSPDAAQTVDVKKQMEPGRYVIRFLVERHLLTNTRKKTWNHEARVSLAPLELELKPGSAWRVELTVGSSTSGGALAWKVLRDGKVADEVEGKGSSFASWPKLCEEILANIPERKWDRPSTRDALVGCAEWESLWTGIKDFPTRAETRKKLAAQEYRPVF